MEKKSLCEKYKGGVTIYFESDKEKKFPDHWLVDETNTDNENLFLQAYDSNLFPTTYFLTWKEHAIKDVCKKMSKKFIDKDFNVYLDGHLLDKENERIL